MIDSRALLKKYILLKLKVDGRIVGDDVADLKKNFGLSLEVSNTQFIGAVRSLQYSDREVNVVRPREENGGISDYPIRTYAVYLR